MADNTNKVKIDAAFFYELFRKANETDTICKECREEHTAEEFKALEKERDELKAKLDCADVDRETYKDRAEAAERCIEEISKAISRTHTEMRVDYAKIEDIIRAYREKKDIR